MELGMEFMNLDVYHILLSPLFYFSLSLHLSLKNLFVWMRACVCVCVCDTHMHERESGGTFGSLLPSYEF